MKIFIVFLWVLCVFTFSLLCLGFVLFGGVCCISCIFSFFTTGPASTCLQLTYGFFAHLSLTIEGYVDPRVCPRKHATSCLDVYQERGRLLLLPWGRLGTFLAGSGRENLLADLDHAAEVVLALGRLHENILGLDREVILGTLTVDLWDAVCQNYLWKTTWSHL